MDTSTQIRGFLSEYFILGDQLTTLDGDASFLENGIVDSTGVMELVAFVEEAFGITVDDDEVVPDHFDSVNRLAAYVQSKLLVAAAALPEGYYDASERLSRAER